ncbi:MAG: hypothetical protein P1U78_00990 [Alcanivoracaceae bacterium]|nr:hypothetical protein [Alcanivoracaceae bacterium]
MARLIPLVCLLSTLVACGGGGSDSGGQPADLREVDLSGTWVQLQTRENYLKETGEYLYTNTYEDIWIIRDDVLGTVANGCEGHGIYRDRYVIKTDKHIFIGPGYSLNPDGTLEYQGPLEDDTYDEDIQFKVNYKFIRISVDENTDFGMASFSGDADAYGDAHVCLERRRISYEPYEDIVLRVPFQDDRFSFLLRRRIDLTSGVYTYSDQYSANELLIQLSCWTDECRDADADSTTPIDVEVTLTNVSPERITGNFSFTDKYGNQSDYTGEFDIFPPQVRAVEEVMGH